MKSSHVKYSNCTSILYIVKRFHIKMTFHYSKRLLKATSYKFIYCQIIQIQYIV